jgi:hypothetical protein
MRTRPFLSYARADRRAVVGLKKVLSIHGTGGWRDVDDLALGELATPGFEQAIESETAGFLWYGSARSVRSDYINTVEIPAALARKRREPRYPLVPLFATVQPSAARALLTGVLSPEDSSLFMDSNGALRAGQPLTDFHRAVARGYQRAAVRALEQDTYTVAVCALAGPTTTADFTFDWRSILEPDARVLERRAAEELVAALRGFRDAAREITDFPRLTVDVAAPLPLGVLLGYEWRVTTRLSLSLRQRVRSSIAVVAADGPSVNSWPAWREEALNGTGPCILAVSTTHASLRQHLCRYAEAHQASRTLELHVPDEMGGAELRGLARYVASALRDVCATGAEKHLLLAGPTSLAVLIGASSNANGPLVVPFWNGQTFSSPLTVG